MFLSFFSVCSPPRSVVPFLFANCLGPIAPLLCPRRAYGSTLCCAGRWSSQGATGAFQTPQSSSLTPVTCNLPRKHFFS